MKKLLPLLTSTVIASSFITTHLQAVEALPSGNSTVVLETVTPALTETFTIAPGITIDTTTGSNGPAITSTLALGEWTIENEGTLRSGDTAMDSAILLDGIKSITLTNQPGGEIQGADSGLYFNNISTFAQVINLSNITGGLLPGSDGTAIEFQDVKNPNIFNSSPGVITAGTDAFNLAIDIDGPDLGNLFIVNQSTISGNILINTSGDTTTTFTNVGVGASLIGGFAGLGIKGDITNDASINSTQAGINIYNRNNETVEVTNTPNGVIKGKENIALNSGIVTLDGNGIQRFNNSGEISSTDSNILISFSANPDPEVGYQSEVTLTLDTGSLIKSDVGTPKIIGSMGSNDTLVLNGIGTQVGDFTRFEFLTKNGPGAWSLGGPGNFLEFDFIDAVGGGTLTLEGTLTSALSNTLSPVGAEVGTTNIKNTTLLINSPKDGSNLVSGKKYPILRTAGFQVNSIPVTPGTCDPATENPCFGGITSESTLGNFNLTLSADQNGIFELNVIPTPKPFAEIIAPLGPTSNDTAIANYLDSLGITPGSPLGLAFDPILNQSDVNVLAALGQLAPANNSDFSLSNITTASQFNNSIFRHNNDLRTHNPPPRKTSVWARGFRSFDHRANKNPFAGFDSRTFGFTLGIDHFFFNNHFSAGTAFGYAHTNLDFRRNLGGLKADNVLFGLYTSYKDLNDEHAGYYFDLAMNASYNVIEGIRSIPFLGLVAKNDHHGFGASGQLNGGYNFALKDALFGPFASFGYYFDQQRKYTESGAGVFNLTVARRNENLIRAEVGARIFQDIEINRCTTLSPSLKLSWVHKNPLKRNKVNTGFVGFPGLTVSTFDQTLNQLSAGLGLTFIVNTDTFIRGYYEGEYGDRHATHELGANYTYRF